MLRAAVRDLQWRRRRVLIAVVGTGLVCGMTLMMTGLSAGFDAEAHRTVRHFGADGWVVRTGSSGPFMGASPMAAVAADGLAAVPGITAVGPISYTRKSVEVAGVAEDVNVFGAVPGAPGMPETSEGRPPRGPGEVAVSTTLPGYAVGDDIVIAGSTFRVVGEVKRATALAGTPNLYLTLPDAQAVGYASQPVIAAIAYSGSLGGPLPEGLEAITNEQAGADLLRAVKQAKSAITLVAVLLWLVAATIIGSVMYLSALERQRDFAVFKATGVATRSILGGLVFQAVVVALAAAAIGVVVATLLIPRFPLPVSLDAGAYLLLPVIAVLIGLVASASGLRRVAAVDPALAFRGP